MCIVNTDKHSTKGYLIYVSRLGLAFLFLLRFLKCSGQNDIQKGSLFLMTQQDQLNNQNMREIF